MPAFTYEGGVNPERLAIQREGMKLALAAALGVDIAETGSKPEDTLVINADPLNLREGPGSQHPVIGQLTKDARVQRLETIAGWYRVQGIDGLVGWISDK